jgi:group I intron endonuclease
MPEKICGIYSITNKINNKRYIGSSNNIYMRWYKHKNQLSKNEHPNAFLQNSYNKYGKDSFIYEIIELCEENKLMEMEDKNIVSFQSMNKQFGYNFDLPSRPCQNPSTREKIRIAMTGRFVSEHTRELHREQMKGNNNGSLMSKEAKEKLSKRLMGNKYGLGYQHSEETKEKISISHSGEKNVMFGKHHSEETKIKISKRNIGRITSEETRKKLRAKKYTEEDRKKMSERMKGNSRSLGVKHSQETKNKASERTKGKNNPNYGKHHSEETRAKIKEALRKRKEQIILQK